MFKIFCGAACCETVVLHCLMEVTEKRQDRSCLALFEYTSMLLTLGIKTSQISFSLWSCRESINWLETQLSLVIQTSLQNSFPSQRRLCSCSATKPLPCVCRWEFGVSDPLSGPRSVEGQGQTLRTGQGSNLTVGCNTGGLAFPQKEVNNKKCSDWKTNVNGSKKGTKTKS